MSQLIVLVFLLLVGGLPVWATVLLCTGRRRGVLAIEVLSACFAMFVLVPTLLAAFSGTTPSDQPLERYSDTGISGYYAPISSVHGPTLAVLATLAVTAYVLVRSADIRTLPPLVAASGLALVLLGCVLAVAVLVQVATNRLGGTDAFFAGGVLGYIAVLYLLLALGLLRRVVARGPGLVPDGEALLSARGVAGRCRRILARADRLPTFVLLALVPVLALVVGVLIVFGQAPDAMIRAFTETASWTLSQQVPPPPIDVGESHYLCTVAAGGTPAVVRPLRMGERRGGPIVVNRQLLVSNAFEDLIAVRLPRTHRVVRGAYDTYGYPLSTRITTPAAADLTYRLMKPAEWAFVAVLYLCDVRPEERIARQYLPADGAANR